MTQDPIEQEKEIEEYLRLLQVYSIEEQPEQWANTQANLGVVYLKREQGNRNENVSRAIYHLEAALHVLDRIKSTEQWAYAQNTLGIAYLRLALVEHSEHPVRGEPGKGVEYLERAIDHFQLALGVVEREKRPGQWATTQHNLGVAFTGLGSMQRELTGIRGEARHHYERAYFHFGQALQIYTKSSYPEQWALIQEYYLDGLSRILGGELVNASLGLEQPTQLAGDHTTDAPPPSMPPPTPPPEKKKKKN